MAQEAGSLKIRTVVDGDQAPNDASGAAGPPPLPGATLRTSMSGAPLPTLNDLLAPIQSGAPSLPTGAPSAQTDADWARAAAERWSNEPADPGLPDDSVPVPRTPVAVAPPVPPSKPPASNRLIRSAAAAPIPTPSPAPPPPGKPSVEQKPAPAATPAPAARPAAEPQPDERRPAKRRPAGPSRPRVAANDDAPTIGGLIYALNQKPSNRPFQFAAIATAVWALLGLGFGWLLVAGDLAKFSLVGVLTSPGLLTAIATLAGPIGLFWLLAMLVWRADELHLKSSAMTEVAIRLAEPDRQAEVAVASLGQSVRRQVSFMNEAVEKALSRASELEAMVQHEVGMLDRSYEENERRIRGLIQELAGERTALISTSGTMSDSLRAIGSEVPALIEKLTTQQLKLSGLIDGAGQNLTMLESALGTRTDALDTVLTDKSARIQIMLEDYTGALNTTLTERSSRMQSVLQDYTGSLNSSLTDQSSRMQLMLEGYTGALNTTLTERTDEMQTVLDSYTVGLDEAISSRSSRFEEILGERTQGLQTVFDEYARALDTTLANRTNALDNKLVERTRALDDAFTNRLQLFDEAISKSALQIDGAIGQTVQVLSIAMDSHARTMTETIGRQAGELDETILNGITAVRRTSENITRQSIKAIEGLAGQADFLKTVSENLLTQVGSVTNRFEQQGQTIMRAANALESANSRIDSTLQARQADLSTTLERLSGTADSFTRVIGGYSAQIEGTLTEAEMRARSAAEAMQASAENTQRTAIASIERLKLEASTETDRAIGDLRNKFSTVTQEVSERLGSLSSAVDQSSLDLRQRTQRATAEFEADQARLRQSVEALPVVTRESSDAVRRSLNDQMRALEQLSSLTSREAVRRDVSPPAHSPPQVFSQPQITAQNYGQSPSQPSSQQNTAPAASMLQPILPPLAQQPLQQREPARPLASLTSTLANELARRQVAVQPTAPAAQTSGEGWSMGDLLKRASHEDDGRGATLQTLPSVPPPVPVSPDLSQAGSGLQIEALASALDVQTAAAIWARFRAGQRGFMVRSIYVDAGRFAFDEANQRYRSEPSFRDSVNRFLLEFETILRQTEQRDPGGQSIPATLTSDVGRVYLLLAHVAGRLM